MDYGPFMSMTLEAPAPAGNFAYKGIVLPLRSDRSAAMVFDTDLLRWSAGWQGPKFIDWHNVLYDGSHTTHCKIVGEQIFGTSKGPGWTKPGTESFDDPRELPFGPMPAETLDRLAELGDRAVWVRGNCEREALTALDGSLDPDLPEQVRVGTEYTAARLKDRHREMITDLPLSVVLDVQGLGPVRFAHATTSDDAASERACHAFAINMADRTRCASRSM